MSTDGARCELLHDVAAMIGGLLAGPEEVLSWLREHGGKAGRRLQTTTGGRLRDLRNRSQGLAYKALGHHPDPDVTDEILADRIRSSLGPLEKRLDVPRVHVSVCKHVASLHGAVPGPGEARVIVGAVERVFGVWGVDSQLKLGLTPASTRPSDSRRAPAFSDARRRLSSAVRGCGVPELVADAVWRTVLATLVTALPRIEREQLLCHLPADVRDAALPRRRLTSVRERVRNTQTLVRAVVSTVGLDEETARWAVGAVMETLKDLVPEEAADVAAILPADLRRAWEAA